MTGFFLMIKYADMLNGKVAVITGGTSGIGLATAREFVAQGARVVITGRKKAEVEKTALELNATGIVSDQASLSDIDELVKQVTALYETIDILFVNAGIVLFSSIKDATEEHFDRIMDINFKGGFFTLRKFLPVIK